VLIDTPWHKGEKRSGEMRVSELYPLLFSEHISLRMATAALGAFAIGLYYVIEGGLMFYDLYGVIINVTLAPLSVLLVSGMFTKTDNHNRRLISFLALTLGIVFALGNTRLYGVSLCIAFGAFVTLYVTKKEGALFGILCGALLGSPVSIESIPLLAFASLVYALLSPISTTLGCGGALAVSMAWGIYTEGLSVLNGTASALVCSILLFSVIEKFLKSKPIEEKEAAADSLANTKEKIAAALIESETDRMKAYDTQDLLNKAKDGFSSMSDVLYTFIEKAQSPSASDMKQICDNAFDCACASCENKRTCWSERYKETSDALVGICSSLVKKGSVSTSEIDDGLICICTRLPDILSGINHNAYLHTRQLIESDRTEVFALDYSALAMFLDSAITNDTSEYEVDHLHSEQISKALSDIPSVEGTAVYGKRQRKIAVFVSSREDLDANEKKICAAVKKSAPFPITDGVVDNHDPIIRFFEKSTLTVTSAERNIRALGESHFCGDTSGVFYADGERMYSFISDGMGSGREAALTSGLCGIFLKKFLSSKIPCECVLKLLNGFLLNRGNGSLHECSATVDLMELDLIRQKAYFFKSGAAPTYIFRGGGLFKMRSRTVPIGIIKEPDFKKIEIDIASGDLVVMVSDGVTDGKEECPWLFDLLRSQGDLANVDRLADLIVKYAKAEGASDDISVLVIKVS
jgi:stage II sporulation protein E